MLPIIRIGVAATLMFGLTSASAEGQPQMFTTTSTTSDVSVPHHSDLVPTTGITVEAWVYHDTTGPGGTNRPTICRKNPGQESYILRADGYGPGPAQWILRTQNSGLSILDTTIPMPVNTWVHLAATYDNSVARAFFDGVEVLNYPVNGGPLLNTGSALKIGRGNAGNEVWNGSFDELRIWAYPRTASEIMSTMQFELDNAPGLVAAWHFNGNFQDNTGGHHATPQGGVALLPATSPLLSHYLVAPSLAPIGSALQYTLWVATPMAPYVFDISGSGSSPGIPVPGVGTIPLNRPLLNSDYGAFLPPGMIQGFVGLSPMVGPATPIFNLPPDPSLVGMQLTSSFILLDATAPLGIGFIGNGATSTVTSFGPTIASIAPSTSPQSGNWPVTITGAAFQTGAQVTIGGVGASNVVVVDPQTITCTTPPGSLGPADVTVTNPDTLSDTLPGGLTYVQDLVLLSVSPLGAPAGAVITITGSGFQPGLGLSVAGMAVTPLSVTGMAVTYSNPSGVPCGAQATVTNPAGQMASISVNPTPSIAQVVPSSGPAAGGGTFFLLGINLLPGSTVTVGGVPATATVGSPGVIIVTAPPGSPGVASVVVTTPAGCTATASYTYQ